MSERLDVNNLFRVREWRCQQIALTDTRTTASVSGSGFRTTQHILTRKPVVDWFEIISENYMIDGGRPLAVLD